MGRQTRAKANIGTRLQVLRTARGLSQADMSTGTDLSQSYISRIERGAVTPTLDNLASLARFFAVSLEELVEGTNMESVVNPPGFPEQYGYCPNMECPETLYRYLDPEIGYYCLATVQNFWNEINYYKRNQDGPTSPEEIVPHGFSGGAEEIIFEFDASFGALEEHPSLDDLTPLMVLKRLPNCEVEFRWTKLDENTKFCKHCGTKLRNTCPYCELPLKTRNQKFCHGCGRRLNRPLEEEKKEGKDGARSK